jgi:hypothetical protein
MGWSFISLEDAILTRVRFKLHASFSLALTLCLTSLAEEAEENFLFWMAFVCLWLRDSQDRGVPWRPLSSLQF